MSIIQISKIQQRSGDLVDLPQLDEAELGFASDVNRLFIGKTTGDSQNIEVLTAYSEIAFSQIDGVVGNINIEAVQNGQVLAYDGTNWINAGGNALQPNNANLYANANIHLGNVSNVFMGGGAIGYTLTTDGSGNLSWTPKSILALNIQEISASSSAVLTLAEPFPFPNVQITINGIDPSDYANNLNAVDFYIDPVPGNLQLYDLYYAANGIAVDTSSYGNYPVDTGVVIFNTVTSTGNSVGLSGSVQYSDGAGGFVATTGFTFTAGSGLDVPGNVTVTGNVWANSGTVRGTLLTGTLTTAAQPNITSVGTLTSLTVSGNTVSGNVFANSGTVRATTLYGTTLTTGANTTAGTITGNWTLSSGSRLTATYADLAEYYCADEKYEPGTVLQFGGKEEVTLAQELTNKIAGVVTTNPAYVMNTTLECEQNSVMIALAGRVPCKVIGPIAKGDMLVSAGNGYAKATDSIPVIGTVVGKAIQSVPSHVETLIEVMVNRL